MHKSNFLGRLSLLALCVHAVVAQAEVYVVGPEAADIRDFDDKLGITVTDSSNQGLSVTARRALTLANDGASADPLEANETFSAAISDLTNLSAVGKTDRYIYKALSSDETLNNTLFLSSGTTGGTSNLSSVIDLGSADLTLNGANIEAQGAIFITTVNSDASSGGLLMDGLGALGVNALTTGQIIAAEIIEQTPGNPGNFKIVLDLNSTFKDGASFVFAKETAGTSGNSIGYSELDTQNSRLFDTSYVINSSAAHQVDANNESVVVTFSRDNNEYIEKSFTRSHPSNDAALKLGTIAKDGVALGDMQTALTRLDINDFGYGNDAANLAVQVKRLAPIANNSFLITNFDGVELFSGATDYRYTARRGNWSGDSTKDVSSWVRVLGSATNTSGSVPVALSTSQDTAGHDGFDANTQGLAIGLDKTFKHGLLGASLGSVTTRTTQSDDRQGERSKHTQQLVSLYGQINDRYNFLAASAIHSSTTINGVRKTAIDRVADYKAPVSVTELQVKLGHRFDLSDGRSAITPFASLSHSRYKQSGYEETGAGALSLNVSALETQKNTAEVGLNVSHKGRVNGLKALTVLDVALGRDFGMDDLTINARYTGATHTSHSNYTAFTAPAEAWAGDFVKLGANLQLEAAEGLMVKMGVNGEMRNGRQNYSGELGLVWVY